MTDSTVRKFVPALLGAAASLLFICSPAKAGYIVTLEQVGFNVVATGSGALDLTGLTLDGVFAQQAQITPNMGRINTGPATSTLTDVYYGTFGTIFTGPIRFGFGITTLANSGSGGFVGFSYFSAYNTPSVTVPLGYVSNSALLDSSTYNNANFITLDVTPGTYEWTWGIGANQNFTLQIGPASVPDSGSTFGLLFLALIALFGAARFRSSQLA